MTAPKELRSIVERIERLDEEIKGLNDDKRDLYAEAKSSGFDVKALKAVIAYRRKDPTEAEEHSLIVETYLAALAPETVRGTVPATRVHAHEAKPAPSYELPDIPPALDRRKTVEAA